ncbi:MAG: lamin tail domain-containing protein [Bacteroidaceae bacterium]|nr:lamin tail domain-containing protein [Bacteroidaceae bacterium]
MNRILPSVALVVLVGFTQGMDAETLSLVCTEVCVANIDQTIDFSNNYGGWVELYNPSDHDVSLNGWYISDDAELLRKHRLSGYDVLKPGCYQCVFFGHNAADGEYGPTAEKQVRFKLNRKGGTLYLSGNGTEADLSVTYPKSIPRCSYARVRWDADEWQYCGMPTPGFPNVGHYAQVCLPAPEVDCDSRLFTSEFDVHVWIPFGTTLRYTTDGSTPTLTNGETSTDGLFPVSQTTVLRLRLFSDDKLPSSVVTRTYIYKDRNYYLPVVAITTDPRNLYDNMIGCYVDGKNGITGRGAIGKSNLNMDWERPVNFEYLTDGGKMVINQEASFEVAGGWSRHFKPASFKVQAKKLYDGNSLFDYPVFTNKPYFRYKQLLIRNGGNNNRTDGGSRIKDAITQQVLTTSGFYVDAQEYQPAHVFINGKYLAMMNVREPSNRFHGAANYGYDDDEMDSFEYSSSNYQQKSGTREVFDRMMQLSNDADTDEGYARVAEILDIDEFACYMATICYVGTSDWVLNNNNVKGYRSQDNGKFHFVFFDQDLTWEKTNNVVEIEANSILNLYRNIKRNKNFRQQFVTAYCILHGSIYTPDRCQHIADSICVLVKDALLFDNRYTTATYRKLQQTMWEKSHREARMKSLMQAYALSDSINVDISTNCAFARIQIDGMDVPFSKFSGVLFAPVSVTINAAEGYRFIGWRDQYGRWLSHEKECRITKDGIYMAVYDDTPEEDLSPLCINEVSAANDIYVNDYGKRADWIELYNRGQEPVDVAQWFFSDDEQNPTKYQIDKSSPFIEEGGGGASTIVRPNGHLVIWCDGKPSISEQHLPFKLKNADKSTLILQSADGRWRDAVRYNTHSSKESVGRYPDGGNGCLRTFYHPTIGAHNMASSYDSAVDTIPTVVFSPTLSDEIESICYYTISGIRTLSPTWRGIYIKVVLYKNGQHRQGKVCIN